MDHGTANHQDVGIIVQPIEDSFVTNQSTPCQQRQQQPSGEAGKLLSELEVGEIVSTIADSNRNNASGSNSHAIKHESSLHKHSAPPRRIQRIQNSDSLAEHHKSDQPHSNAIPINGQDNVASTCSYDHREQLQPIQSDNSASSMLQQIGGNNDDSPDASIQLISYAMVGRRLHTKINTEHPKNSIGLSSEEATERLARNGPNVLTPPKETNSFILYLKQYLDPFMLLIMMCGVLSFVAYAIQGDQQVYSNIYIGSALFLVVIISATFGHIQAGKASAVMSAFKNLIPQKCRVIRDGKVQNVMSAQLVVGDLVRLGTGDQCPADLRIIYVNDLKVEVSSLTGEPLPISTTSVSTEDRLEEAKNIVFNTSQCLEGDALGVVFATGDATYIGRIAGMASSTEVGLTPLQVEVNRFFKRVTMFALTMGVVFFCIAAARSLPLTQAFVNGFIIVLIANVPQSLPVTVTSALTITAKLLAERNVFVKQLNSVETLGSTTVICSDKTGTLTQNKMSVSRLWFDLTSMTAAACLRDLGPSQLTVHSGSIGSILLPLGPRATLRCLERVAAVCSRTRFEDQRELTDQDAQAIEQLQVLKEIDPMMSVAAAKQEYPQFLSSLDESLTLNMAQIQASEQQIDDSQRKVNGDASETAIFNYVVARHSIELIRYHNQMIFEVPFNSRNKYALTIMKPVKIKGNTDERRVLLMKGAPEVILTKCSHYLLRGRVMPIDDEFIQLFTEAYERFGSFGERVLGFAHLELSLEQFPPEFDTQYDAKAANYPTTGLVFLGLMSLVDPPKETVPAAIAQCRSAGVRVVMVTGDHPLTAAAIAREIGIMKLHTRDEMAKLCDCSPHQIREEDVQAVVVSGADIDQFTLADWDRVCSKHEIVFARTTPQQKLEIVGNFQRLGNIVAATGDGVNDSPALKKADIGVAMGISGSDVARDAADVILMDDEFNSVVVGIREGRTIFDNLTKTVAYTMSNIGPKVLGTLLSLALGFPLTLGAILILCIDTGTDMPPAIALAYEKSECDVMTRPPRNAKKDHLVTSQLIFYSWCIAGLITACTAFLNFFLVFDYYGYNSNKLAFSDSYFLPDSLDGSSSDWVSNGHVYTSSNRRDVLLQAQTAYFATVVGCQVFHVLMCKTRSDSIFRRGLFGNVQLSYGILLEIAVMLLIVFSPAHAVFGTQIFPGRFWTVIFVGWFGLFLANEPRKLLGRRYAKCNKYIRILMW